MIRRVYVEKRPGFDVEARQLADDLRESLGVTGLRALRLLNRYDLEGLDDAEYSLAVKRVLAEPQSDYVFHERFPQEDAEQVFAIEFLPGQFDQRADSAAQCIQILTHGQRPRVACARVVVVEGEVSAQQLDAIKHYLINTVDSREASLAKPATLAMEITEPAPVASIEGFTTLATAELDALRRELGLAMSHEDILFCQRYFRDEEDRDPTLTEIRVLDTYWSDHCRHTTFLTHLEQVEIADGPLAAPVREAWQQYLRTREVLYAGRERPVTLMDIATIGAKALRKAGKLDDLEQSEEINAASIIVPVDVDGRQEEWLVMFKNETHNHPTEIEPFGGAATCLGGAIRDPLSGRAWVYQAMRVTGAADPRVPFSETLPGKLPQRKITREAARGYSSYGNQIGLATGSVHEVYHPAYVAKRMEIGAVIGAAPRANVYRGTPEPGDVVLLVGGRTGRDGIGGATGSSKEHDQHALQNSAEVQKGDAPSERKLQRLFRNPEAARMVVRCNDFGAGGVSVAIGELAPSLHIHLDRVPRKYEGLDGTEIAISESQERMAIVLRPGDVDRFMQCVAEENLEGTLVADVTDTGRLVMEWRGQRVVDLQRSFLDTAGAPQTATATLAAPEKAASPLLRPSVEAGPLADRWTVNLRDLNRSSQRGLIERFDSTVGAGSVLHPFGGSHCATPPEAMAAKIPVLGAETRTGTLMSYGFNPQVACWSPFHGATFAIVEAMARIVASGGDAARARLTLQEYFPKVAGRPERWGLPLAALLGALRTQLALEVAAIGGKDSMSGSFKDLDVPPTLVAFAVSPVDDVARIVTPEFKQPGSAVILLRAPLADDLTPDFPALRTIWAAAHAAAQRGEVRAMHSVRCGGIAEALSRMAFGNRVGVDVTAADAPDLFLPLYGSLVMEVAPDAAILNDPAVAPHCTRLGATTADPVIRVAGETLDLATLQAAWEEPLEAVFPARTPARPEPVREIRFEGTGPARKAAPVARPRVIIPVFPGNNCEYDTARAFERAGAEADVFVFRNLTPTDVDASLAELARRIRGAQMLVLPGGFSAGDEPDGSGKFAAAVFRNSAVADATMDLLRTREGLILGICNGFQALVKLGLLQFGEIRDLQPGDATLTFNAIGRHQSGYVRTKIVSRLSPWLAESQLGDMHVVPISHGEGRLECSPEVLDALIANGQVATQYVDASGQPSNDILHNPNGSICAIEGISSPCGRVFAKMAHSERHGPCVGLNIAGDKDQPIFKAGVRFFA